MTQGVFDSFKATEPYGRSGGWGPGMKYLAHRMIPSSRPKSQPGRYFYAEELRKYAGARVTSYGFRGDSRAPWQICDAGGFWPNVIRDDLRQDRALLKEPATPFSLMKHVDGVGGGEGNDSKVKGYPCSAFVSFTRSIQMAVDWYAWPGNWLYVALLEGAIDVNRTWCAFSYMLDKELAMPGGVDWTNVVAFRRIGGSRKDPIYFRHGFDVSDPIAYPIIRSAMSF